MHILRGIFRNTIYVKVRKNRLEVRHIESKKQVLKNGLFTTERSLIGNFIEASTCLTQAMNELEFGKTLFSAPRTIIHPIEMIEGGLSQVENRVFLEVAYSAGSKNVLVWIGNELDDDQVIEKTKNS